MKKVGIIYHPKLAGAKVVVERLSEFLSTKVSLWLCSAWEEEEVRGQVPSTDLALSVGGDGTILRAARAIIPWETPILGINVGKLGFMTELSVEEAMNRLPGLLAEGGWIDKRTMLQAELFPGGKEGSPQTFHALNDVVVERGAVARTIYVKTVIDSESLTTYKADGVIVSTATGSTGYSLAAGGPILYPQAEEIVLKPVSAHLTLAYPLVLPPTAIVELEVSTDYQALLSIDGQLDLTLESGDRVRVQRSPYQAHFLRVHPASFFYSSLEQRLKGVTPG